MIIPMIGQALAIARTEELKSWLDFKKVSFKLQNVKLFSLLALLAP